MQSEMWECREWEIRCQNSAIGNDVNGQSSQTLAYTAILVLLKSTRASARRQ